MKTNMKIGKRPTLIKSGRIQYIIAAALIALTGILAARGQTNVTTVTIPAGTKLLVKLDKAVSSSDKRGILQGDLGANGAVKTGSAVIGEVTDAKKAKRVRGKANVIFELKQINVNGALVTIDTEPVEDIAASSTKKTAKGAAKGAAIGAVANDDSGEGAKKGAAVGAGASALKKGESAGAAAGEIIEFKLAAPFTVTVK
jgi:hypothetical protein